VCDVVVVNVVGIGSSSGIDMGGVRVVAFMLMLVLMVLPLC